MNGAIAAGLDVKMTRDSRSMLLPPPVRNMPRPDALLLLLLLLLSSLLLLVLLLLVLPPWISI